MSSNNNSGERIPTAAQQQPPTHGNVVFIIPPPPTIWVQFNDGMQMALTPSPAQYLQSVLNGIPLFRSASGADSEGYSNNGFMNTIHELFQRAQEQQHGPPPTSKPFLDKLPVKVWTQEMEKTENQTECVICLSDYEKDDTIISLPCGHTFHKGCGLRWLLEHNVCPTCRYQLPTQTEVFTSQSDQPTIAGTTAGTEPEQEPSMPATTSTVTGVRRQRPTETFCPREVRQRVDVPAPVDDVVDLDFMLEQEADRFMKEEMANSELVSHDDGIEINDSDIDELINETLSS